MSPLTINRITILGTGLLAMVVFGALCIRHNVPAIEDDLTLRAEEKLRNQRMGWAEIDVDGRDVTISGIAPDARAMNEAAAAAAVYGVRRVNNALTTIEEYVRDDLPPQTSGSDAPAATAQPTPPAPPYRTRFRVTDGGLIVDGYAPDEDARRRMVRTAQDLFGVAAVEARVEVRDGAPADWEQAATAALDIADQLVLGEIAVTDNTVSVTGLTGSERSEEFVANTLGALPANYSATSETGSRTELESVLRTSPGLAARLDRQQRQRSDGAIRSVASLDTATCEQRFRETLADQKIPFDTASADLTGQSQQLLTQLAAILKLCPRARVTIEGHTDDQGLQENNLALSQRRAEAVMQFLVAQGVSLSRLSARGYGEERPLVENRTAEDRAVNRRIEFVFGN